MNAGESGACCTGRDGTRDGINPDNHSPGLSPAPLSGGAAPSVETTGPEQWYVANACVRCHREQGGRLAEIVDLEWAKSVHYENNVPCESCHGGDATLTREQFSTEEEFKRASHLSFKVEFLFLRDRAGVGNAREDFTSYACKECHADSRAEGQRGDPHTGPDSAICLWGRYGGVSTSRIRGIAYVCADCHTRSAEKHLGSPHGSFGAPSCLFCHGNGSHAIPVATIDILDTRPREELGRCSPCHKPNTMTVVARIREALEQTVRMAEAAAAQFEDLKRMGYRNLALAEMHDHVDEIKTALGEELHGSDIRAISELARSVKNLAKRTAYDHDLVLALQEARQRQTRVALGAAGLLLLLACMLVAYRRAYCERAGITSSTQ